MSAETPDRSWTTDPAELDRTLEGQLDPAEAARRRALLQADPRLAEQAAGRTRFLTGLREAGATWRAGLRTRMPEGLESRVRAALARRAWRPPRWIAAAALVLLGLGVALWWGDRSPVEAMPPAVLSAAQAAREAGEGPRGCSASGSQGPLAFPPVRDGSLLVYACVEKNGQLVAQLYRPEELPSVGYAAVAAPGTRRGPVIGRTDLGDVVVFDIPYGRKVHYLAVNARWLAEQRARTPGRESCRACHNLSRVGKPNPHDIVQRSWKITR
jgi:hypothetical protein